MSEKRETQVEDNSGNNSNTLATPDSDVEGKLAEAVKRIKELEAERDSERIRVAVVEARKPTTSTISSGQVDAGRRKLIGEFTNARYHLIPPDQRCAMQGVPNSASIKDSDLKKVFGKTSIPNAASQLMKSDPEKYRLWRIVSIERGIL